ncbi:MAG: MaoC/PaaZ C-terminal domain-containing protein [Myxococcota bacterium]|nr:MaoC/PaaZ C-terminal domain-containing protein [Myxococcota bacterium]
MSMPRTCFEDIPIGWRQDMGRWALTKESVIEFAREWDPQPFHIDEEAAKKSIYGSLTASSLHLFAICTRLFFDHASDIAVLAMLGKDAVRFPNPARAGSELHYTTECTFARASETKTDRGIITLSDTLSDESGAVVLSQEVSLLLARRR